MDESGLRGYEASAWYGIFVPAATPRAVAAQLNADLTRALKAPEVRDRLAKEGTEVVANDAAGFSAFLRAEIARIRKLAAATSITLD